MIFDRDVDFFELAHAAHKRQEYDKAIALLRRGAVMWYSRRYTSCAAWLGHYHEQGYGVRRDPYTAMQWFEIAIQRGGKRVEEGWVGERYRALKAQNLAPRLEPKELYDSYIGLIKLTRVPRRECDEVRFTDSEVRVKYYDGRPYDFSVVLAWQVVLKRAEERRADGLPEVIDESFRRDYDHFHLRIARGTTSAYGHRCEGDSYTLLLPARANCHEQLTREAIIRHAMRLMHMAAESYLTRRSAEISKSSGLSYKSLKIGSGMHTVGYFIRAFKLMYLSWHVMKFPHIYIDSLIYHELCHSLVSGHNSDFYDTLRRYGGEEIYIADKNFWLKNNPPKTI